MADAFLGVPIPYTLTASTGANANFPASNLLNEEPGLPWRWNIGGNAGFNINLEGSDAIGAIAMMGIKNITSAIVQVYATEAHRNAGTPVAYSRTVNFPLSANSSSPVINGRKGLIFLPASRSERFINVTVYGTGVVEAWRLLILKVIQPSENIEVGASFGVDDRSDRRFGRSGRMNVDPSLILPTFSGQWPWIEIPQWRTDFRPLMLKKAGAFPVYFCMDHEETTWGEDETIYGYLEKQQQGTYEDGLLMSFSFGIVGIAQ